MSSSGNFVSRVVLITTLVIAGELVFGLPFSTARFFRPTLLEVFGFSNTQLGDLFAVYGIFAALSYFPGGAIADRFSARFLLTASLAATAFGGLYMATIPGPLGMACVYAYWGVTTIFLFWGALIRATRDWGGNSTQGTAFGILEGGRGLVMALFAAFVVAIFAVMMPDDATTATDAERRVGFQVVILLFSAGTLLTAALTWFCVPESSNGTPTGRSPFQGMKRVAGRPIVWAQAAIIICAYCGYKGLDNYSLYAVQVLGMDEVDGAWFATLGAYIRPVAALLAGLVADRFNATWSIALIFAGSAISYFALSVLMPDTSGLNIVYLNLFVTYFTVYALRGIYFALLQDNHTPIHLTGATVGMVSLVGYMPEIFFAPVTGRILDANPGLVGFQHYFLFLAGVSAIGVLMAIWLVRLHRRSVEELWPAQQLQAAAK